MQLKEADYNKMFSKETMAALKGKSGESLRSMLGNKTLMQTLQSSQRLLTGIEAAEADYHSELESIAIEIVKEAYPIVKYANIKIDARIGQPEVSLDEPDDEEEEKQEDELEFDSFELDKQKRRIINGITQGASIRGAFAFLLFREYLDIIDETLYDKYNELMKLVFGIYDDDNAIAMMLAMLEQGQKQEGGSSEAKFDEEKNQFVITARALCFPMLVHEIVKGLFEITGTEGFGTDKERNKSIINSVDKLANEPEDLRYGKFIYDKLNELYTGEDNRVRDLLFASIYKMPETEFVGFIENAINDKLTSSQKAWVKREIQDIESDVKADDSGF